jgi:hypothetical protein
MAFERTCVPAGQAIILRVIFLDACGEPVNVDTGTLELYLYDSTINLDTVQTAVDDDNFSGATVTVSPASITNIDVGFYEYVWTVPSGGPAGAWHDVWVGDIETTMVARILSSSVVVGGSWSEQSLDFNQLVVITLDETIAGSISGDTLSEDTVLTFSTLYNPLYASTDLVRLEAGPWLDGIPDDTLCLMIHWSSIEVDQYAPNGGSKCSQRLAVAKTKFTTYDAMIKLLLLPAGAGAKTKRLADLMIKNDVNIANILDELKELRREWLRVVNAGGCITPGQGFSPSFAVKGIHDPDRRAIGRLWFNSGQFPYSVPNSNAKIRPRGHRRFRHGHIDGLTRVLTERSIDAAFSENKS